MRRMIRARAGLAADETKRKAKQAMTKAILTLNAGSSSLKVALFALHEDRLLASGQADRIGPEGVLTLKDAAGARLPLPEADAAALAGSHTAAMRAAIAGFAQAFAGLEVRAIGHRVVHGGIRHSAPQRVDAALLAELEALAPFAPLHQPHNLAGIRAAMAAFPDAPQVACFDTAFHRGHAWVHDTFALPRPFYDEGVRRYGFHGLSYDYVAGCLAEVAPDLAKGRVVVAHLGNGASMCAIHAGRSVASSMGFSALDGLPMGTRCGRIDPGVLLYLMDSKGMDAAAISDLLYRRSGLLGMSGVSNDMRALLASDRPEAAQAIGYFIEYSRREIAALDASMGGIDGLIFCGGIGENAAQIRAGICEGLGWMGLGCDAALNEAGGPVISAPGGLPVMVIPTNEEVVIARAARAEVLAA